MLQKIKDPHYLQYSPIASGIAFIGCTLMGSVMLAYKSLDISLVLYLSLALLLVGIALQLKSNRVLHIRIYQMMIIAMMVTVFLIGAALFLADGQELWVKWFVTAMLLIIFIGLGVLFFFRTRRLYTPTMPHGPLGILNPKTGVVDSTKSPPKLQRQLDKHANQTRLVWKLIPLTAGLALAFVRGLPDSGADLMMMIIAIIVVVGSSGAVGSALAYVDSTLRWERKHGKQITVKR